RYGENVGQLLDPNQASILKSAAAAAGQPSGQVLHGTAGSMSPQVQGRSQQLPGSAPEIKTEMNPILNPRAGGPEVSLIGIPGSNQGGNNLTLKGWPLTVRIRSAAVWYYAATEVIHARLPTISSVANDVTTTSATTFISTTKHDITIS
ncbi:hypothetical protein M8C21_030098, partial [Ambrosia artemisiifolia]